MIVSGKGLSRTARNSVQAVADDSAEFQEEFEDQLSDLEDRMGVLPGEVSLPVADLLAAENPQDIATAAGLGEADIPRFSTIVIAHTPFASQAEAEASPSLPMGSAYYVDGENLLRIKTGVIPVNTTLPSLPALLFPEEVLDPVVDMHPGEWSSSLPTTYEYALFLDGGEVMGTKKVTVLDVGRTAVLKVRATNARGTSGWVESAPVTVWHPKDEPNVKLALIPGVGMFSSTGPDVPAINGAEVVKWSNSTATVFAAAQTGAAGLRPHYAATGINGKPALTLDGGDQLVLPAEALSIFQNMGYANIFVGCQHSAPADGVTAYIVAVSRGGDHTVRLGIAKSSTGAWTVLANRTDALSGGSITGPAADANPHSFMLDSCPGGGFTDLWVDGQMRGTLVMTVGTAFDNTAAAAARIGRAGTTSLSPAWTGAMGPMVWSSGGSEMPLASKVRIMRWIELWVLASAVTPFVGGDPEPESEPVVSGLRIGIDSNHDVNAPSDRVTTWLDPTRQSGMTASDTQRPTLSGGFVVFDGVNNKLTGGGKFLTMTDAWTLPAAPGSFTITGLAWDAMRNELLCGSDGRIAEGDGSPYRATIVRMGLDRTKVGEIPFYDTFSSMGSMQGIGVDTLNNTYWVPSYAENFVRQVSKSGTLLPGGFAVPATPNGCAYDPASHSLFILFVNGSCRRYSCATGELLATLPTLSASSADHLQYLAGPRILLATAGQNGATGQIYALEFQEDGAPVGVWRRQCFLVGADCIEGVYTDGTTLRIGNDAKFHNGNPNVNRILEYSDPGLSSMPVTPTASVMDMIVSVRVGAVSGTSSRVICTVGEGVSDGGAGWGMYCATSNPRLVRVYANTAAGTTQRSFYDLRVPDLTAALRVLRLRVDLNTKRAWLWCDGQPVGVNLDFSACGSLLDVGDTRLGGSASGVPGSALAASYGSLRIAYGASWDEMSAMEAWVRSLH